MTAWSLQESYTPIQIERTVTGNKAVKDALIQSCINLDKIHSYSNEP